MSKNSCTALALLLLLIPGLATAKTAKPAATPVAAPVAATSPASPADPVVEPTDPPSVLSLESSILFALDQNPSIQADMEKIKQSNFAVDEARSAYYPQVSVNVKAGHEYDDPAGLPAGVPVETKVHAWTNSMDANVLVNQILYNGFATDAEVDRRKSLETSAGYSSMVTIEGVLQNAVEYYVNVWRYQRAVRESEAFVESLEKIGRKVTLMNAAGAESKAKKEYVDSRVAAAHTELNKDQASLTDALSNLESLTGPLPKFTAQKPLPLDPTVRKLDSYYDIARTGNNHLLLNESDHNAIEHQIEEQDAAYVPTVSLQLDGRHGYDVGGHVGNEWNSSAMVVMDYKIFDGFSRDSTEGRLKSQRSENEYRQVALARDLDKDIRKSYNEILATKQDLGSNMKEILSSENLQDLYTKQFELGEGDIITMIEGAERLHNARLNSFRLEANMVVGSYSLMQKIGALRKERFCTSC